MRFVLESVTARAPTLVVVQLLPLQDKVRSRASSRLPDKVLSTLVARELYRASLVLSILLWTAIKTWRMYSWTSRWRICLQILEFWKRTREN